MANKRMSELPLRVRNEVQTLSKFIKQSTMSGNADEARHWRDVQDGYLQALEAVEIISESERHWIMGV